MRSFLALMKLEIGGIFSDLFAREQRPGKKKASIGRSAAFAIVMLLLAVGMVVFELRTLDVLISLRAADVLLKLLVALSMFMTAVYGLMEVLSRLYFSNDIRILSYLPVGDLMLYSSRLCAHMFSEIAVSAVFIIPGTVVFMTRTGFDAMLLLRALIVTVFSPMIPVLLCALISGLLSKVPGFWAHKETVTTVFSVLLVFVVMVFSFFSGQMGGSSVDDEALAKGMMDLSGAIDRTILVLPPIGWAARALTDGGIDMLLMILVSIASALVISFLFSRGYIAAASQGTESSAPVKAVDVRGMELHGQSPLKALALREIREMVRTPAYLLNGLLVPVIMPTMMIVLILISVSQVEGGTASLIAEFSGGGIGMLPLCFFLTGMMCMMMGMNSVSSTAISREGRRHSLMVSLPVDARTIIRSKMDTGVLFSLIGVIPPPIICAVLIPGYLPYALLSFLWAALLAYIGSALGLIIDLSRPRLDWINETKAIKSNMNQIFGLLLFFVILGLNVAAVIVLYGLALKESYIILAETCFLLLFAFISRLILFRRAPAYTRFEN